MIPPRVCSLTMPALGGGGSILTVPALVYAVSENPRQATTASLVIVGVTALTGTIGHARSRRVRWGPGLVFGVVGTHLAIETPRHRECHCAASLRDSSLTKRRGDTCTRVDVLSVHTDPLSAIFVRFQCLIEQSNFSRTPRVSTSVRRPTTVRVSHRLRAA